MKEFYLQNDTIFAVPILHYTMEFAMVVRNVFREIQPDCVAVELPEIYHPLFLHAASRLPDISVIGSEKDSLYYLCEPCDPIFEALRGSLEDGISSYSIDLAVKDYPFFKDLLPDPYAIMHIGLKSYYENYQKNREKLKNHPLDETRELQMAKRLKELSFSHEKILFVGGFHHVQSVLEKVNRHSFPTYPPEESPDLQLATLTEESSSDVMAEWGWLSSAYEEWRSLNIEGFLDRQKLIFFLYKAAAERYKTFTGNSFCGYHLANTMKFLRNLAHLKGRLMPNLFEILTAAKSCVDHNYAYEVWLLATSYPYRKNVDNLKELNLSIEEVWGSSKQIKFHLKQKKRKGLSFHAQKNAKKGSRFLPPSPFSICSYPPEDLIIEKFGDTLKKKGAYKLMDEGEKSLPFLSSLENGVDVRETIRHFYENKLYVKLQKPPLGVASSVIVIFNEDLADEDQIEKYPWKVTWLGEHNQESDMAFYATSPLGNVVGPGISRCEYGGFMMTSPPRRVLDIWSDPDYIECRSKGEALLMAAVDYAVKPLIIYVAERPPRPKMKRFAARFGKKISFIPIGNFSPITLNQIRTFHVLEGHDKREIAGDYIY